MAANVIASCPGCGTKNRLQPAPVNKCGRCGRIFTPRDVAQAAGIARPEPPPDEPELDEEDGDDEDAEDWDDED